MPVNEDLNDSKETVDELPSSIIATYDYEESEGESDFKTLDDSEESENCFE